MSKNYESNHSANNWFLITKGGHLGAIINNIYTVVKNIEKEPIYTVYNNLAKGNYSEGSEELKQEFTAAFLNHFKEIERKNKAYQKAVQEAELARIKGIEEIVKGMTPQEVAEYYDLEICETAGHWNDLYTGRSSFALKISSAEENEIVEIAGEINNWSGEFGELINRAGEHHHNFSGVYSLEDYRQNCRNFLMINIFSKAKNLSKIFIYPN